MRPAFGCALPAAFFVALPTAAFAHASQSGYVLLLPTGHYIAGGALTVLASFCAVFLVPRKWLARLTRLQITLHAPPESLRPATSLASMALFAALVVSGLTGTRDPLYNPLPIAIWTLLWVALTLVQELIGDLWRWIDPWHGPLRILAAFGWPQDGLVRLPATVRQAPAVGLFFLFAWFELIDPAPDDPRRLAIAATLYFLFTLAAMLVFGERRWRGSGEFLSIFFSIVARFAPLGRTGDGRLSLRLPGARLAEARALPLSGLLFVLLALSSVSFDGLSHTFSWAALTGVNPLAFPGRSAVIGINTIGLAASFALLAAAFLAAILLGERLAGGKRPVMRAAGLMVWSIVPIAIAYHFAHYLTDLLVKGQYALVAFSDPFWAGWDLLGAADYHVAVGVVLGADAAFRLFNIQVGAIVAGHVLAVLVAHGLAGRLHAGRRQALLAELPLAALMIGYTVFGLWLLSTPTIG